MDSEEEEEEKERQSAGLRSKHMSRLQHSHLYGSAVHARQQPVAQNSIHLHDSQCVQVVLSSLYHLASVNEGCEDNVLCWLELSREQGFVFTLIDVARHHAFKVHVPCSRFLAGGASTWWSASSSSSDFQNQCIVVRFTRALLEELRLAMHPSRVSDRVDTLVLLLINRSSLCWRWNTAQCMRLDEWTMSMETSNLEDVFWSSSTAAFLDSVGHAPPSNVFAPFSTEAVASKNHHQRQQKKKYNKSLSLNVDLSVPLSPHLMVDFDALYGLLHSAYLMDREQTLTLRLITVDSSQNTHYLWVEAGPFLRTRIHVKTTPDALLDHEVVEQQQQRQQLDSLCFVLPLDSFYYMLAPLKQIHSHMLGVPVQSLSRQSNVYLCFYASGILQLHMDHTINAFLSSIQTGL